MSAQAVARTEPQSGQARSALSMCCPETCQRLVVTGRQQLHGRMKSKLSGCIAWAIWPCSTTAITAAWGIAALQTRWRKLAGSKAQHPGLSGTCTTPTRTVHGLRSKYSTGKSACWHFSAVGGVSMSPVQPVHLQVCAQLALFCHTYHCDASSGLPDDC